MEKEVFVFCPANKPKIEKFFVYCEVMSDNSLLPLKYSPCDNYNGSEICHSCSYSLMKQITENCELIFESKYNPLVV